MKSDPRVIRCCRKKLHKGRSLFSRAVDYIALRMLIFMLCCMWFGANIANYVAKILLSAATTLFISIALDLMTSMRLDALIRRERTAASKAELARRISLLSENDRNTIIRRHIAAHKTAFTEQRLICSVGRPSGVIADDVIRAARRARELSLAAVAMFYVGNLPDEAKAAAGSMMDMPFEFISITSILDQQTLDTLVPTGEEIDAIIISHAEAERTSRRAAMNSPFAIGHAGRYLLCAALLMAMSFYVDNSLYFRLMAAVCVTLSATAWWLNKSST